MVVTIATDTTIIAADATIMDTTTTTEATDTTGEDAIEQYLDDMVIIQVEVSTIDIVDTEAEEAAMEEATIDHIAAALHTEAGIEDNKLVIEPRKMCSAGMVGTNAPPYSYRNADFP